MRAEYWTDRWPNPSPSEASLQVWPSNATSGQLSPFRNSKSIVKTFQRRYRPSNITINPSPLILAILHAWVGGDLHAWVCKPFRIAFVHRDRIIPVLHFLLIFSFIFLFALFPLFDFIVASLFTIEISPPFPPFVVEKFRKNHNFF